MLIVARSQVGIPAEESVIVLASARQRSSLHSNSVKALSIIAAKRFLYSGSVGSVVVKSIWCAWASGGALEGRNLPLKVFDAMANFDVFRLFFLFVCLLTEIERFKILPTRLTRYTPTTSFCLNLSFGIPRSVYFKYLWPSPVTLTSMENLAHTRKSMGRHVTAAILLTNCIELRKKY